MKRTTRKLSGQAKDRFLARILDEEPELGSDVRRRLLQRLKSVLTSVRIRKADGGAKLASPARRKAARTVEAAAAGTPATAAATLANPATAGEAKAAEAAKPPATFQPAHLQPKAEPPPASTEPFDPYAFGLVPVFQREGRDGLMAKLATVDSAANLRAMARTQQIVLPAELRSGEVAVETLRGAIADAVARRVADRRAAAG